jgi:hypothetical protein
LLLATAGLAACVPPQGRPRPPPPVTHQAPVSAPLHTQAGLELVMGRTARALIGLFGNPGLDVREGPARKLQFLGPGCVLDAYLYTPRRGGDPVVTHIDARLPDGRDTDKAACVEMLSRR